MSNSKKKHQIWNDLKIKYQHLEKHCSINVDGLDDDSNYFHPKFTVNESLQIRAQGDIKCKYIYGVRYYDKDFQIEIGEHLLEPVIIGASLNYERLSFALQTLAKVRSHINQLDIYTTDYVTNILIGNSIEETTDLIINELRANKQVIKIFQEKN